MKKLESVLNERGSRVLKTLEDLIASNSFVDVLSDLEIIAEEGAKEGPNDELFGLQELIQKATEYAKRFRL